LLLTYLHNTHPNIPLFSPIYIPLSFIIYTRTFSPTSHSAHLFTVYTNTLAPTSHSAHLFTVYTNTLAPSSHSAHPFTPTHSPNQLILLSHLHQHTRPIISFCSAIYTNTLAPTSRSAQPFTPTPKIHMLQGQSPGADTASLPIRSRHCPHLSGIPLLVPISSPLALTSGTIGKIVMFLTCIKSTLSDSGS
jgi:hypothetical protein